MADEEFRNQRLASILDALDPDRSDLEVYAAIATEFQATRVLDVGCGTGALALMLVSRGISVVGVDPARASLDVARSKLRGADVRWIEGDATRLPPLEVDLATMTGNVAQAILDEDDWHATLQGVYDALEPGGLLVFETRIPSRKAWLEWNRAASHRVTDIAGIGPVETWVDLLHTQGQLVRFRWTYVFPEGDVETSESTIRFRDRTEIEEALIAHDYTLDEVRDAPDRPGREFVFLARRR